MTKQELARLRFNLVSAVTEYDRKQSTKPSYNMYALPQYLERVSEIMDDIAAGADPRAAITAGFTGTLLSSVLRRLKMSGASRGEMSGMGSMTYEPVAKRNPKAGTEGLHFVVTQDSDGDTVLHVFDSEDQAGLYHGQLRGYGGVKRIGRLKGSRGMSLGYIVEGVTKQFGAEPRIIRHDQGETNPVRPRKGEKARDFIARCMSEEHSSFPEPKQRIAVCLSKSRKRNPVYDTGSDE